MNFNELNYHTFDDAELVKEAHSIASSLSYYNAAESGSWAKERDARKEFRIKWEFISDEMNFRGIEFNKSGYLI